MSGNAAGEANVVAFSSLASPRKPDRFQILDPQLALFNLSPADQSHQKRICLKLLRLAACGFQPIDRDAADHG